MPTIDESYGHDHDGEYHYHETIDFSYLWFLTELKQLVKIFYKRKKDQKIIVVKRTRFDSSQRFVKNFVPTKP